MSRLMFVRPVYRGKALFATRFCLPVFGVIQQETVTLPTTCGIGLCCNTVVKDRIVAGSEG